METLRIEEIHPVIRIANHHRVGAGELWDREIPDLQLICILAGEFEYFETPTLVYPLTAGEVLLIEPNTHHQFRLAATQETGWIAGVHFEFIPHGTWAAGDYRLAVKPERVTRVEHPQQIQDRFQHLAAVFSSYRPYRQFLANTITTEILLVLAAYWQTETAWVEKPSPRMGMILAYIREHLSQSLNRRVLASVFNLSPGYINERFQAELGMTPSAVINRERLARAYQLMDQDGLSVTESSLAVGYLDPFYFSRLFKQHYGFPPSAVSSQRRSLTRIDRQPH